MQGLLHAADWPCWSFADEEAWVKAFVIFLDNFEKGDEDWEELLFKVWVARVLNHTIRCISLAFHACLMSPMIFLR